MAFRNIIPWISGLLAVILAFSSLGSAWADPGVPGEITPTTVNAYMPVVMNQFDGYHSSVAVRKQPAFDACHLPSLSQMQVWWDKSPYWSVNLYLGGSSLYSGCNTSQITREWLSAADQQGWTFIPTWVGPQAPCNEIFKTFINENPTTARQQGKQEADTAVAKARSLGFDDKLVLYLDIEGYAHVQTTACRTAVNAYVSGWVERLHEAGVVAGAYGSTAGSHVSDWAAIPYVPDDVWAAYWSQDAFSTSITVMGIPALSDALWAKHQRIRQYAGDHNETWGGVTLNIDSDAADGALQVFQTANRFPPPPSPASSLTVDGPVIVDLQQVTSDQGWILTSQGLQWTRDNGKTWEIRMAPEDNPTRYLGAYFIDSQKGWLVAQAGNGKISLYHTDNNGQSWQEKVLASESLQENPEIEKAYVAFTDDQSGWISLKLQTGSAFSQGVLLRTRDAGLTWEKSTLPVGGPVFFTDEQHAWVIGGLDQNQFFASEDGGKAWNEVSEESAKAAGLQTSGTYQMGVSGAVEQYPQPMLNLPDGTNTVRQVSSQSAWALVWSGGCSGEKTSAQFQCNLRNQVFATNDNGHSWSEITPAQ